jgi:hypothetical protein
MQRQKRDISRRQDEHSQNRSQSKTHSKMHFSLITPASQGTVKDLKTVFLYKQRLFDQLQFGPNSRTLSQTLRLLNSSVRLFSFIYLQNGQHICWPLTHFDQTHTADEKCR